MLACPIYFDNYFTELLIKYITINYGKSHILEAIQPTL
jgi:hypothetical protein